MSVPFDPMGTAPSYESSSSEGKRPLNEFTDAPSYEASEGSSTAVFDPLKAPPYDQQLFDPEALKAAGDKKDPSLFDDERGRGIDRGPGGTTGARSVSRTRDDGDDGVRGRADGNATVTRERVQSPSRAMGARSGSYSRSPRTATIQEEFRGGHGETGLRSREAAIEEDRGRGREAGPPSSGRMGSATGMRSPSATRS